MLDVERVGLSWGRGSPSPLRRVVASVRHAQSCQRSFDRCLAATRAQQALDSLASPLAWFPESGARHRSCCCRLVGAGAAERACLDPCGDFPVVGVSAASQVIRRLCDRHRVNRSREIADADPSWAFSSRRVCVSPVHWGETWCRESRDAVSLRVPGIWVSRTVRNAPPSEVGQRILRFRRVSSLNGRSGRMLHSHSSRQ